MSFLDMLKRRLAEKAVDAVKKGITNKSTTFRFQEIPTTLEALKALPEADLKTPYKTAALTLLALMNYETAPDTCIEMLNFLSGPDPLSQLEKQFLQEALSGKFYKPASFFEGATPDNGYQPNRPYVPKVSENQYSHRDETHTVLYLKSGGADLPRQIDFRKKPSTGQWFVTSYNFLSDIRIPKAEDPWA